MINQSNGDVVSMESLEPKAPQWIWPRYIVRPGINLIVGAKGVGKTSAACWLAAGASRGDALFGGLPLRVFIDSLEDDPEVVLRPRLEAAEAAMDMIETRRPGRPAWKFPRDFDALHGYLEDREQRGLSVDLILLDSLSAYLPRFTTPEHADETLETLTWVSERYGCGVVFVHHFNKSGRTIDTAIGGAGAVTRVARSVFVFGEEPPQRLGLLHLREDHSHDAGEGAGEGDERVCVLACVKMNIAARPPALRFLSRAVEIPAVESVHRLELVGETEVTAQSVFEQLRRGPVDAEQQTETDTAIDYLLNALLDGPQPTRQLIADASADGISKRTLERARAQLDCESIHPSGLRARIGEDAYEALTDEQQRAWWVALPEMPDAPPREWDS